MKLIGLDVGDRRIGVAFGDTELRIATPLGVIVRTTTQQDALAIARLAQDYDAHRMIVGLPRNMDGTLGHQAQATQVYADELGVLAKLSVTYWDERLSTIEATRRAQETGARGKKSRRSLDAVAAAVILQDYMDNQTSVPSES